MRYREALLPATFFVICFCKLAELRKTSLGPLRRFPLRGGNGPYSRSELLSPYTAPQYDKKYVKFTQGLDFS